MTEKEQRAKELATKWHGDQKYGDQPYIIHLQAVVDVLGEHVARPNVPFGSAVNMRCAGWLHDVLEDTDMPVKLLYEEMGHEVLALVWAVTGFGKNRKERAQYVYDKINENLPCATLKAADRIANMRASKGGPMEQMYMKDWRSFHDNVAVWVPPSMQEELKKLHEE